MLGNIESTFSVNAHGLTPDQCRFIAEQLHTMGIERVAFYADSATVAVKFEHSLNATIRTDITTAPGESTDPTV